MASLEKIAESIVNTLHKAGYPVSKSTYVDALKWLRSVYQDCA